MTREHAYQREITNDAMRRWPSPLLDTKVRLINPPPKRWLRVVASKAALVCVLLLVGLGCWRVAE